jgi:6-pyruvoyltetrahydropterin/6-carboxytetrahydropterin synthase
MYRISKVFTFSAAHRLNDLPLGHQCGRMHGHNYEVEVFLESTVLDDTGFVRDYGELAPLKDWIEKQFEHRLLNEVIPQPTAELLATYIYHRAVAMFHEVVAIRVSETGKTTAVYSPHSLPPLDAILNAVETLAEEPVTDSARSRLVTALKTILGMRATGRTELV